MKRSTETDSRPVALVLELRHPLQLAERRHRPEQPRPLGVLRHVALHEERAAVGLEAGAEQGRGGVEGVLGQRRRVVGHRDRVQVDDAVERLAQALVGDVVADRPDVVAEMLLARWAGCRRRRGSWVRPL